MNSDYFNIIKASNKDIKVKEEHKPKVNNNNMITIKNLIKINKIKNQNINNQNVNISALKHKIKSSNDLLLKKSNIIGLLNNTINSNHDLTGKNYNYNCHFNTEIDKNNYNINNHIRKNYLSNSIRYNQNINKISNSYENKCHNNIIDISNEQIDEKHLYQYDKKLIKNLNRYLVNENKRKNEVPNKIISTNPLNLNKKKIMNLKIKKDKIFNNIENIRKNLNYNTKTLNTQTKNNNNIYNNNNINNLQKKLNINTFRPNIKPQNDFNKNKFLIKSEINPLSSRINYCSNFNKIYNYNNSYTLEKDDNTIKYKKIYNEINQI